MPSFDELLVNFDEWFLYVVFGIIILPPLIKGLIGSMKFGGSEKKMKTVAQSIGFKYVEESKKFGTNTPLHVLKGTIRGYAAMIYYINERKTRKGVVQRYTSFDMTIHGVILPCFRISIIESGLEKHLSRWFGGRSGLKFGDPSIDESLSCVLTDVGSADERLQQEQRVKQLLPASFLHTLVSMGSLQLIVKGSSVKLRFKGFLDDPIKFNRAVDVLRMLLVRV